MNPLKHLLPALYAKLATPALMWLGTEVPVYEHLAGNTADHYVLLEQPTSVGLPGSAACKQWTCTALVDVVTQFPTDNVSSAPADELVDQITGRLEGQRLTLPDGYDCGPARLELQSELRELDGEYLQVRRLLRFRWDVFFNA